MKCWHCKAKEANRPRGLCWTCYMTPKIRGRYAMMDCKSTRRGSNHEYNGPSVLGEVTAHRPYSPECFAVMQDRVERGEAVRQPGDATLDDDRGLREHLIGECLPGCPWCGGEREFDDDEAVEL
jgi:hypothetical protein